MHQTIVQTIREWCGTKQESRAQLAEQILMVSFSDIEAMWQSNVRVKLSKCVDQIFVGPPYLVIRWVLHEKVVKERSLPTEPTTIAAVLVEAIDLWVKRTLPRDARDAVFEFLNIKTEGIIGTDCLEILQNDAERNKRYYFTVDNHPEHIFDYDSALSEREGHTGSSDISPELLRKQVSPRTRDGTTGQMRKGGSRRDNRGHH